MSNRKYVNFAAGWLKSKDNGEEYISATTKSKNRKGALYYVDENEMTHEIDSFAVFFNTKKQKENHPDVQFTFLVDEN